MGTLKWCLIIIVFALSCGRGQEVIPQGGAGRAEASEGGGDAAAAALRLKDDLIAPATVCAPWPENAGNLDDVAIIVEAPANPQWYGETLGQHFFAFSFNNELGLPCEEYDHYEVYASPAGSGCWSRIDAASIPQAAFTYDWCSTSGVLVTVNLISQPTDVLLRVGNADFSESVSLPIATHDGNGQVALLDFLAGVAGEVPEPSPEPLPPADVELTPEPMPEPPLELPPAPQPTPAPEPLPNVLSAPTPAPQVAVGLADPMQVLSTASLALPAFNQAFMDPAFGTSLRRITDQAIRASFGTQTYSQLQAFSPDSSLILLIEDEEYLVRRVSDLGLVPAAHMDELGVNTPRWQPGLSNTLVFYDGNGDTALRVLYWNATADNLTTRFTFPANYERIRPNQSFDELSEDGRWMGGLATTASDDEMLFALNLETQALGAELSLHGLYTGPCSPDPTWGEVEPDWVGVSPLGRYLVVQWARDGDDRCSGMETYDIQTGQFVGHVVDGHQHGDLGSLADGTTEFFMTFAFTHPDDSGNPGQALHVLPGPSTGIAEPTYLQSMAWGTQSHISCRGPNGVCLITSDLTLSGESAPYAGELWLQYADGRIWRLAHHRSTSCGYWVQPRATISRDGRFIVFASDWGNDQCAVSESLGRGDAYIIELPAGAVAAGP